MLSGSLAASGASCLAASSPRRIGAWGRTVPCGRSRQSTVGMALLEVQHPCKCTSRELEILGGPCMHSATSRFVAWCEQTHSWGQLPVMHLPGTRFNHQATHHSLTHLGRYCVLNSQRCFTVLKTHNSLTPLISQNEQNKQPLPVSPPLSHPSSHPPSSHPPFQPANKKNRAYRTHPRRLQLTISFGLMTFAGVGLIFSPETRPEPTPAELEKARLKREQKAAEAADWESRRVLAPPPTRDVSVFKGRVW